MSRRVLVMDTSVLCCWLAIPGKETAGPDEDRWDRARISNLVEKEEKGGSIFVLPLASLIETGNHIAQSGGNRFKVARDLSDIIVKAADAKTPWAAFTDQADLWGSDRLKKLADDWPPLAAARTSIGDATIKDVAEWYAQAGMSVEIITGDAGLKAYEPQAPVLQPRRRN